MANVFENFAKFYDQTINTDATIKRGRNQDATDLMRANNTVALGNDFIERGKYADFADWMRLQNQTVLNTANVANLGASTGYTNEQAKRFGLETPGVIDAQATTNRVNRHTLNQLDDQAPGRQMINRSVSSALGGMGNVFGDIIRNKYGTELLSTTMANKVALAGDKAVNLTPGLLDEPANTARDLMQFHTQERALSGVDPKQVAAVFGGDEKDYVFIPSYGWIGKDGQRVLTNKDRAVVTSNVMGSQTAAQAAAAGTEVASYAAHRQKIVDDGRRAAAATTPVVSAGSGPAATPGAKPVAPAAAVAPAAPAAAVAPPPAAAMAPIPMAVNPEPGHGGMLERRATTGGAGQAVDHWASSIGQQLGAPGSPGRVLINDKYTPVQDEAMLAEYVKLSATGAIDGGIGDIARKNIEDAKTRVQQYYYYKEANAKNNAVSDARIKKAADTADFVTRFRLNNGN